MAITAIFITTAVVCFIGFIVSCILFKLDRSVERIQKQRKNFSQTSIDYKNQRDTTVSIIDMSAKDYTNLRKEFWCIMVISILFYMSIFPFISIGTGWFKRVYGVTDKQSRWLTSVPYIMSMFLTPTVGFLVDRVSNHLAWIIGATIFAFTGHTVLVYLQSFKFACWIGMSLIGVAYSTMAATLTPMIAFLVPVSLSATAFGLIFGAQSIAIAFTSPLVGKIRDNQVWGGDDMVTKFFMLALTVGVLSELFLVTICGLDPKSTIAYRPSTATCGSRRTVSDSNAPVNFPRNFESELVPINERDGRIIRQRSASNEQE